MVDDTLIKSMYATKRRRRTVKSVKTPTKDPPKSNPSKRHRERLNSELDHLASLLPFEQSVISKLDKLSILRLGVSYLRTKSYFHEFINMTEYLCKWSCNDRKSAKWHVTKKFYPFTSPFSLQLYTGNGQFDKNVFIAVLPDRYHLDSHYMTRSHLLPDPHFSEGESILQALYGFLFVVTCDSEVFYAARTVEQYLGFHQSDIIHQSVMELIHSEDREEFKRQLTWNSMLPTDKANLTLHEVMMPENYHYLHRSFTVRFRCLLDNTSGFITLEISGWIRVMHGQNTRSEEPHLALFATCCPFGPLSLLDLPSRELTFKSKHKMDFAPISMDNRGKMMFGYSDRELASKSGYDLIHPDDLTYFSNAHQELIKTGSSGLIAYRWLTKDLRWIWLQSSCKVIYKNSKPDFVITTHRQLTDDEGQDLFHKRGNEFKLPYPLLDLDVCSGFDFPNEDLVSKMKGARGKKQKTQVRDYLNSPNKKRKMGKEPVNGLNGYGTYPALNCYDGSDFKPEFLYHYPGNNVGLETDLLYNRSHSYSSYPGTVYPNPDPYRLDVDKHSYTNGYYIDSHRQYQHTLSYHGNSYADLVAPGTKYGYDVAKYNLETYSLDLAKKVHYNDDVGRIDNDFKKYGYDYRSEWLAPRLNGSLEPVDLRSYNSALEPGTSAAGQGLQGSNLLCHGQSYLSGKDSRMIRTPDEVQTANGNLQSLTHNSVIKSMSSPRTVSQNRSSSVENLNSPNTNGYPNQQQRANVIHNGSAWSQCSKTAQTLNPSPNSTPQSDHSASPKHNGDLSRDINRNHLMDKNELNNTGIESPMSGATPASVIHSSMSYKNLHDRSCEKQPLVGGIPVPVVKTSYFHNFPSTHNSYGEYKDWSSSTNDMYAYQRQQRGLITDSLIHAPKIAIP